MNQCFCPGLLGLSRMKAGDSVRLGVTYSDYCSLVVFLEISALFVDLLRSWRHMDSIWWGAKTHGNMWYELSLEVALITASQSNQADTTQIHTRGWLLELISNIRHHVCISTDVSAPLQKYINALKRCHMELIYDRAQTRMYRSNYLYKVWLNLRLQNEEPSEVDPQLCCKIWSALWA